MTSVREFIAIWGWSDAAPAETFVELWTYNTISCIWKRYLPPVEFFKRFCNPITCSENNTVYMCGRRYNDDDLQHINFIVSFDVINTKWITLYSHTEDKWYNAPPPIDVILHFCHNGSPYVIGIHHEEETVMMLKLCLKTKRWSSVQQFGEGADFNRWVYGKVYKNQLYIIQHDFNDENKFREIRIFDFSTNVWIKRAIKSKNHQYPQFRVYEAYAFSSNCAYMSGGRDPNGCTRFSDIWRLDLETLYWFKLDYCHKSGTYFHYISIVDDSYLYSIGGDSSAVPGLHPFERFTLRLPSLYRRSLESVFRSPNMTSYIKSLPAAIINELKLNENDLSI